ncbi:MAG TPA: nucleoside-diphosphate sugar epimerase/dehydratase [Rhodocyclaceae bacterium]|nr:nucleoside-diphosphate sugar epimerase/dehydratase [Rhodocyclaceae bacterium]
MNPRTLAAFLHDIFATALMWLAAYWIRFNLDVPAEFAAAAWRTVFWVVPLYGTIYLASGLYRGIWRYASVNDLRRLLIAVGIGAIAMAFIAFAFNKGGRIPRSVFILHPVLVVMMMAGDRYLYRAWKDGYLFGGSAGKGKPVVILGAGDAAASLISDLARSRQWRVVGLFDDNAMKIGRRIGDVPILGPMDNLARHVGSLGARHAIIAMPAATSGQRRQAAEKAANAGLTVFTVPASADILAGKVSVSQVRKVELEDLLGRDPVQLDVEGLHRLLTGKVVLITGAGGSIGSELARQIARYDPRQLVFYEQSEFALYAVEQEFTGKPVACVVGDIRDVALLNAVFERYRPDVVFHAAAYKHVPLMENDNAWGAVRNNVLGTYRVARAAIDHGVGEFVLISTDKAVNPTNVMGASKRLAEMLCQALQAQAKTRFVMVRFGNVLGSSGSVIPKFREQIAKGGPVTVTHPEIIRYFMLIPEAAQLVLQAGLMASAGAESGKIFVLDMGEPVKIADLARDLIRLSGFTEAEIPIEYTGLRPGEKLYEELLADNEATVPTPHPKLRIARPTAAPDSAWVSDLLTWLDPPVRSEAEAKAGLQQRVPEYQPAHH